MTQPLSDGFAPLATPPPCFTPRQAAALLDERYGLGGRLQPLSSERDQNFLVDGRERGRFVLKFANALEPAGVTDFQNQALGHIHANDPAFPAPRVVETLDGRGMFTVTAEDGQAHRVRLLTWLDGVPLDEAEGVTSVAAQTGTMLARLAHLLSDFEHASANYVLPWDIQNAGALAELLRFIQAPGLRALCEARIDRFARDVAARLAGVRKQVIYNDMNPSNLLVDANDVNRVAGVIDFGDTVHSALVCDVAVAAAYLCRLDDDPFADVEPFLEAYSTTTLLSDEEIALLPELIPARHLTTVMITHWRSAMYPHNRDYILRSERRARRMLEVVAATGTEQTRERFAAACRRGRRNEGGRHTRR